MDFELWLTLAITSLLISISPGAGAVNTMSNGLQYGVRKTLPGILGLQLGYGVQIAVVGAGLGALLASSSFAFSIIKWLGVGYLLWLGYKKWTQPPVSLEAATTGRESSRKQFWMAVLVNLTNAKATIFLVALFPQFISQDAATGWLQYVVMGVTLIIADVVVMVGYASLAYRLSRFMKNAKFQLFQNRIFGSMFVGIAALMASYRA
ncbi:MAG: homoserine/homoserine lactone efflux protein [Motiliproteus sp.]|nr:homoserine/homoserine lactone efflux protein [Motiliproteus sp.]MCW9052796.1 homoserine/homoserine lactone efflux protein [Motiliproteus sp.]